MNAIRFIVGDVVIESNWNDSPTSRALMAALPFETDGSYWGDELYFAVPVKAKAEAGASDVVEPGTVAFWPAGSCLCLFWGPTPASHGSECRAASAVNVVGHVTDVALLRTIKSRHVRVEATFTRP